MLSSASWICFSGRKIRGALAGVKRPSRDRGTGDRGRRTFTEVGRRVLPYRTGEQEIGVQCVAVPVLDAPVLAAISISGPEARLTPPVVDRAVPLLREVARQVSAGLAYDGATA